MRVDAYATMDHWFEHVHALWKHLEPDNRGDFHVGSYDMFPIAGKLDAIVKAIHPQRSERPILVASWRDAERCLRVHRKVILMEHGVGQHFVGHANPSYSGAPEHRLLAMRLVPNDYCAEPHRKAHPQVPLAVIGSPKTDQYANAPTVSTGTVALSNHWGDKTSVPEMAGAWFQWHRHYAEIPQAFPGALGHNHPKLWPTTKGVLTNLGFEATRWFSDVTRRAEVYVCDGVSTLYEFASLDRPVVVLNPPHYRRDVHHGGRFWDWADVGVQVDAPCELVDAIHEARRDLPTQARRRREIIAEVYPHFGIAGITGAKAIQEQFC